MTDQPEKKQSTNQPATPAEAPQAEAKPVVPPFVISEDTTTTSAIDDQEIGAKKADDNPPPASEPAKPDDAVSDIPTQPSRKKVFLSPETDDNPAPAFKPTVPNIVTAPIPDLLAPKPAPATSAGTMCPSCGHRNRPGVLICDNCGTNLMTGRQPSLGTRDLKREQETASQEGVKLLDTGQTKAVEMAGGSSFTENMVLRVDIEGATTPMLVYPKQEIILGRRDPNTGAMPDVDLTAYAGYRMGVSRQHAAIHFQDKQLDISDLGSSNGTFLNGTRLTAHRPYQLRDGDEVRLGQMVLKLFFQSNRK
jgi:hypothetical protein